MGGTDKSFSNDLYRKCTDHPRFSASKLQVGSRKFELNHYAGAVVYETDGLVEKNKDEFPREASDLLESSTKALIKDLGVMISTSSATTLSSRERKSQRTTTVSGQFVTQLRTLRERIMSTSPHYIRCRCFCSLFCQSHVAYFRKIAATRTAENVAKRDVVNIHTQ